MSDLMGPQVIFPSLHQRPAITVEQKCRSGCLLASLLCVADCRMRGWPRRCGPPMLVDTPKKCVHGLYFQ